MFQNKFCAQHKLPCTSINISPTSNKQYLCTSCVTELESNKNVYSNTQFITKIQTYLKELTNISSTDCFKLLDKLGELQLKVLQEFNNIQKQVKSQYSLIIQQSNQQQCLLYDILLGNMEQLTQNQLNLLVSIFDSNTSLSLNQQHYLSTQVENKILLFEQLLNEQKYLNQELSKGQIKQIVEVPKYAVQTQQDSKIIDILMEKPNQERICFPKELEDEIYTIYEDCFYDNAIICHHLNNRVDYSQAPVSLTKIKGRMMDKLIKTEYWIYLGEMEQQQFHGRGLLITDTRVTEGIWKNGIIIWGNITRMWDDQIQVLQGNLQNYELNEKYEGGVIEQSNGNAITKLMQVDEGEAVDQQMDVYE